MEYEMYMSSEVGGRYTITKLLWYQYLLDIRDVALPLLCFFSSGLCRPPKGEIRLTDSSKRESFYFHSKTLDKQIFEIETLARQRRSIGIY